MGTIDLMLDEENELTFQLNIEGTRPSEAGCRLVVEGADMSLSFDAHKLENSEISVVLPPLNHVLKEGQYDMSLEVIVDDKYFKPLTVQGNFEKRIAVTAESVVRKKRKKPTASAALVEVKKSPRPPRERKQRGRRQEKSNEQNISEISDKDIMNLIKALSKK